MVRAWPEACVQDFEWKFALGSSFFGGPGEKGAGLCCTRDLHSIRL
jgi:hypothetical protein